MEEGGEAGGLGARLAGVLEVAVDEPGGEAILLRERHQVDVEEFDELLVRQPPLAPRERAEFVQDRREAPVLDAPQAPDQRTRLQDARGAADEERVRAPVEYHFQRLLDELVADRRPVRLRPPRLQPQVVEPAARRTGRCRGPRSDCAQRKLGAMRRDNGEK